MATTVTPTLSRSSRHCRLAITANIRDFWDATNNRYKSGYVHTTITALTVGGSVGSGEAVPITLVPPVYNAACHDKVELRPTATGSVTMDPYVLLTAVNYGQAGPSAVHESDGSVTLVYVDVELPELPADTASAVTVTATYTSAFVATDVYATVGSGTPRTITAGDGSPAGWLAVSLTASGSTVDSTDYGCIVVQLALLNTTALAGASATFRIANAPQSSGQSALDVSFPLPSTADRTLTVSPLDRVTTIFAVNNLKVDANGTTVQTTESGAVWNLANAVLSLAGDVGTASVVATVRVSNFAYP